jgi:hypothetical protein
MSDTVTVYNGNSGGTNYVVATDDITVTPSGPSGHVQYVKLVDGQPDGTDGISGTASGLGVIPRSDVQKLTIAVPGLSTTAYTAGDQMGTLMTFPDAARITGGSGTILGVELVDNNVKIGSVDVAFFTDTTTAIPGDNTAFDITVAADRLKLVEIVSLNYAMSFTSFRFARLMGLSIPYALTATSLYAALISRTTLSAFVGPQTMQLTVYVARD